MHTAQESEDGPFFFVCCVMLFKCGAKWETCILRWDDNKWGGWRPEPFFISRCPVTLFYLSVMTRSWSVVKGGGAVCCCIWGAPYHIYRPWRAHLNLLYCFQHHHSGALRWCLLLWRTQESDVVVQTGYGEGVCVCGMYECVCVACVFMNMCHWSCQC